MKASEVKFLVVHCSATPPSNDAAAKDIDRWHRQRGFLKIGYHYVIRRGGEIEKGRADDEVGAHVEGYNHCSLGICVVGGVAEKTGKAENNFTPEQFATLNTLLQFLEQKFPGAVIQGHRDFPDVHKDCPSFDVRTWWAKSKP